MQNFKRDKKNNSNFSKDRIKLTVAGKTVVQFYKYYSTDYYSAALRLTFGKSY